jgi:2-methylcitrate dehydratase PrpD
LKNKYPGIRSVQHDEGQGAGATLANFVAAASWADVAAQSHEAKRSILNFFATALGSAYDPAVTSALRTLSPFSGAATSAIVGRPERLDALSAAFVNAISANLLDFDDTHLDTIIHPAAPVAAPVLALAQARGFSGRDAIMAFILGVEVECRIGNAVSPGHYARGWHITSTCGVFGAAAACAKLLGLSADGIANAIGIAASQSAGIVENLPTAAKNVSVGNAARNGLFAALLAAEGFDASARSRGRSAGRVPWGMLPILNVWSAASATVGRSPRTPTSPIPPGSYSMRSSTPASNCEPG